MPRTKMSTSDEDRDTAAMSPMMPPPRSSVVHSEPFQLTSCTLFQGVRPNTFICRPPEATAAGELTMLPPGLQSQPVQPELLRPRVHTVLEPLRTKMSSWSFLREMAAIEPWIQSPRLDQLYCDGEYPPLVVY